MAKRTYKRKSNGQFAGSSGGSSSSKSGGGGSTSRNTKAQTAAKRKAAVPGPDNGFKGTSRRRNTTIIGTPRGTARSRAKRRALIRNRVVKGAVVAYAGSLAYQAAKEAAIGRGTARFNQDKANLKNRSGTKTLATLRQSQFGALPKASKSRRGTYKITKL